MNIKQFNKIKEKAKKNNITLADAYKTKDIVLDRRSSVEIMYNKTPLSDINKAQEYGKKFNLEMKVFSNGSKGPDVIYYGTRNDVLKLLNYLDNLNNQAGYNLYREYYKLLRDSVKDIDPREGESKADFLARFMNETKSEYPDEKQRYAVANSYWERKGKDSIHDTTIKHEGNLELILDNRGEYTLLYKNKPLAVFDKDQRSDAITEFYNCTNKAFLMNEYGIKDSIKDGNLANSKLRVGQIVHLDQSKISKKLDADVLNEDYVIEGFYINQKLVKEDVAPEEYRDFNGVKIRGKKSGVAMDVNRFQLQDSINDSTELTAKTIESLEELIKKYQRTHPNMTYGDVEKRNGLYRVKVDLNDSVKDASYDNIKVVNASSEIRQLCINNDWYTSGTNSDYSNLLRGADNGWTIRELAKDIYLHSSVMRNENVSSVESIAYVIYNYMKSRYSYLLKDSIKDGIALQSQLKDIVSKYTKNFNIRVNPNRFLNKYEIALDIIDKSQLEKIITEIESKISNLKNVKYGINYKNESFIDVYPNDKISDSKIKDYKYREGELMIGQTVLYNGYKTKILDLEWDDKYGYDVLLTDNKGRKIWVGDLVQTIKGPIDSIHDDYSSFLGNYGFDYMKGSGDYETWYLKYEDEDFNKLVNRMRAEYPSMIISASPSQKTIYIQKSKYGVKDSIQDEDIEELSKEEQQAIDDYKKAISGTTDVKLLELYSHILREEIEHLRELNEAKGTDSIKDSADTDVRQWWQQVETWNRQNGNKWNINNSGASTEDMLAAMFDMISDLKNVNDRLYKEGKRIYNKYSIYSQYRDSVKDDMYIQTPYGKIPVSQKTTEELKKEGYLYYQNTYHGYDVYVDRRNHKAIAIKASDSVKDSDPKYILKVMNQYTKGTEGIYASDYYGPYDSEKILHGFYQKHPDYKYDQYFVSIEEYNGQSYRV